MTNSISQILAEKTFNELGLDPKTGKLLSQSKGKPLLVISRKPPVNSRNLPFRIPALEKTQRQASSTQGYKASASWQTASLLRDLLTLWFESRPPVSTLNLPLFSRLKAQVLDALRSVVSTFEEGWARPSTKEFLDFLGFSQASLTEVRGNIDRMLADGLIPSKTTRLKIPVPSRNFPYPPVFSRKSPEKYGSLRERLREFTGKNLNPEDFTYELFINYFGLKAEVFSL